MDGSKLFRTRTVRRGPEESERWIHETMQRFAVNVANPTSIPDVPSRRRDVSEHDELDERLDEREHAERQRHVPTSSAEPSRTESDRHKKRKRDPDDNGISVRRKYDEEGDAELLLEDGLMMTRTTDTFDHNTSDMTNGYYRNLTSNRFRSFRFCTNQSSMQLEQEDSTRNWYRRR